VTRRRPNISDVVQVALPDGSYAYGRVLRDAVAFYRQRSKEPGQPPIGSRDFEFIVGVHNDALSQWPVVARDPSADAQEDWPPAMMIRDPITNRVEIYERGHIRPSTEQEVFGLEPVAAWDSHHVVDRLLGSTKWSQQPTKAN